MTDRQKVLKEFPGSKVKREGPHRVFVVTPSGYQLGNAVTEKYAWKHAAEFVAECPTHRDLCRVVKEEA